MQRKQDAARFAADGTEMWRADTRLVERVGWRQLVTPSASGFLNEISRSDVPEADIERTIDELLVEVRGRSATTRWYTDPRTRPADTDARLARRGFEATALRAMGIAPSVRFAPAPGVVIEPLSAANVDAYVDVNLRGWGMVEAERSLETQAYRDALGVATSHYVLARLDGEPVGTAGLYLRDGYGYLVGGQVLEAARGRGVYRALVSARLRLLRDRGDGYAVTIAREDTAAPRLERLGFESLYPCACWQVG